MFILLVKCVLKVLEKCPRYSHRINPALRINPYPQFPHLYMLNFYDTELIQNLIRNSRKINFQFGLLIGWKGNIISRWSLKHLFGETSFLTSSPTKPFSVWQVLKENLGSLMVAENCLDYFSLFSFYNPKWQK